MPVSTHLPTDGPVCVQHGAPAILSPQVSYGGPKAQAGDSAQHGNARKRPQRRSAEVVLQVGDPETWRRGINTALETRPPGNNAQTSPITSLRLDSHLYSGDI